jgi:hypothetical protein
MTSYLKIRPNSDCKSYKKFCPAILKCGTPSSTTFSGSITGPVTTQVASLTLDNTCLCNSCIRLDFTSNIIVSATTLITTISFQVFKLCKNQFQAIPIGSQWNFVSPGSTSTTFTFFVCDCNTCFDKCCTYFVQATGTVLNGTEVLIGNVTVSNAQLSVLAV